ncbi:class I histocompatibility antigen, F10 alpha chain-like isoform X1 [Stegostoma tigrinum]|uniref:class I histocompatibility antigen, F10 alpha chain-like isoform X1 n=2 Tax=Stegostoma tigrinum TaxID=3053191 RepID=UPI002870B32E|nr:class I histocompatibility antigen, F10 alpha chain-like isoform X1 [Stegostoma tigrinum]XP_059495572.1 class I histocompatibility antigen, F10 alpha chain-like isoform X1 [Stegostoma tigrinum]
MLLILFSISLCFSWVSPDTNVLTMVYTAVSGIEKFPAFSGVAMINGVEVDYYDSNIRQMMPRQQFMADSFSEDFWKMLTDIGNSRTDTAIENLNLIMKNMNQTSGIHTLQWIRSVEVSDDGSMKRSMRFGFDGKDFISLEPDRMRWVATNHFAVKLKEKWDSDESWNNYWERYLLGVYIQRLKQYLEAGKEYFKRKVQPEVFIFRSEPNRQDKPLTLSCLVTGFYPADIEVTWLRNGEVLSETQSSGIRPNHDGTHQIRKEIEISAGDEDQYSCQIEHSSLAEAKLYQWQIFENSVERFHLAILIGLVTAVSSIVGIIIWKKPWKDSPTGTYITARTSDVSIPAPS